MPQKSADCTIGVDFATKQTVLIEFEFSKLKPNENIAGVCYVLTLVPMRTLIHGNVVGGVD